MENDSLVKKGKIRRKMRQLRDSLSSDEICSKSEIIQTKLWRLIEERGFQSIMFYIAFGSEVRTQECITKSLNAGKTTIVPVCISSLFSKGLSEKPEVINSSLFSESRGERPFAPTSKKPDVSNSRTLLPSKLLNLNSEVEQTKFGVLEPKPEFRRPFPPDEIELVIVPGLAFDPKGYRIGYGAGYYDRFLPECKKALFIAIAYEMQIVEDTFPSSWDVPVDGIITEK